MAATIRSAAREAARTRPKAALGLRAHVVPLLFCFAIALAVRVHGIGFGLPHIGYYWDEPVVVNHAVQFGTGDLNPHWFIYPAFFMYLAAAAIGAYIALALASGALSGVDAAMSGYFLDPTPYYLAARLVSATFGAATVALAYLLIRHFTSRGPAIVGALLLAASTLHGAQSHIAVTDVPLTFFFVAAALPILGIVERGRYRDYVLAGVLVGLGFATKYLAITMCASIVASHLVRSEPRSLLAVARSLFARPLLVAAFATLTAAVVGTPYTFIEFAQTLDAQRHLRDIWVGGPWSREVAYLILTPVADLGVAAAAMAVIGLLLALRRWSARGLVLASVPGGYLLLMIAFPREEARLMLPVTPFVCLAVALALDAIPRLASAPMRLASAGVLAVLIVAPPLFETLRWNETVGRGVDTRTQALEWMHANREPGTRVSLQSVFGKTYLNVPLLTDAAIEAVRADIPASGRMGQVRERVTAALNERPVYRDVPFEYDLARLRASGAQVLITSSENWPDALEGRLPDDAPEALFLRDLTSQATVIAEFSPPAALVGTRWYRPVNVYPYVPPRITIYELRP